MQAEEKTVGTFRIEGMLEGPLPPAGDCEAKIDQWLAAAKQKGLNFSVDRAGGQFSLLTDNRPLKTSSVAGPEGLSATLQGVFEKLLEAFPAALLGRMITVPYFPLAGEAMEKIIQLQLKKITKRLKANHGAEFSYDDALLKAVVARCTDPQSGARAIDHILTRSLLPEISTEFLARMASGDSCKRVAVSVDGDGAFTYELE